MSTAVGPVGHGGRRSVGRRGGPPVPDGKADHQDWLGLVDTSGPFLTLPVLLKTWPQLDAFDTEMRPRLRAAHSDWQLNQDAGQQDWIRFVLRDLLGWGRDLHDDPGELAPLGLDAEFDTILVPGFVLTDPGSKPDADSLRLVGMTFPDGTPLNSRIKGSPWSATPVDRVARLCRQHKVELGLATDGRWWALVWAPRGGVTTSAVFDAITWPETADRIVVRAFFSLLRRKRFFQVPAEEQLPALLKDSLSSGEDVTEALGVQVRQAVELLVDAIGRADAGLRAQGDAGLQDVDAHDVYRGAVAVMMRIVFLLFAEEKRLLPSDKEVYREMYSAGQLCEQLQARVQESSEEELEHSTAAWHRLLALFRAVYGGVTHPQLELKAYDGSIFDPEAFPWLEGRFDGESAGDDLAATPLAVDDRTVFHMLQAVQFVEVGSGRTKERRRLTFNALDVEQIGYVYEGLLSFEGFRAGDDVVGLIGKAGLEEEVELGELEEAARPFLRPGAVAVADAAGLAAKLADRYKDSKIGSVGALTKLLAPLTEADRMEAERKLHAVAGDRELVRRLLPFYRIIRTDLRDLPVVIRNGALYVTESKLRKNTGTHYTPRFLAEQVAKGALEPLVRSPGPLQTADEKAWKLKSSDQILSLKVVDIAMGSAAFLVAACRYLADRLVEAWSEEGDQQALAHVADTERPAIDAENDPVMIRARRAVIEHCLYGVDINPMAVEMAKLSLWLVSMDVSRPFTFLDDRLVSGDSLLGITSLDQLEVMDLNAARGRRVHERALLDFTDGVRDRVHSLAMKRSAISAIEGQDLDLLGLKRSLLAEVREEAQTVSLLADLTTGVALATAGKSDAVQRDFAVGAVDLARRVVAGEAGAVELAREQARKLLATDKPREAFEREPLHWPLVFPEAFEDGGGFDAVIGNPPFLGGKKISGPMGSAYREYLVEVPGRGTKGNADLVAYMVLRAHQLLNVGGQSGLIATNTLAQGDTREVGLDQIVADGTEIRMTVKSAPWPSRSAVLEYCAVWTSRARLDEGAARIADDVWVEGITPSLDPASRTSGNAERLAVNAGISFQGSVVVGLGFTMEPHDAQELIATDTRNREVLFPYLNGQDLNTNADTSASRWIINFHDWPESKAATYKVCYEQVRRLVKPERDRVNRAAHRERWWQYGDKRPALTRAIAGLDRVIVLARISKTVMPLLVPTGQVFNEKLVVFASKDPAMLALLSSAPHYWWAITRSSTLKTDLNYSPTDVIDTLARPEPTPELFDLGSRLDTFRRDLMLKRQSGLTKTYNLLHDATVAAPDIAELRAIHRDIDYAVARAYGWHDLAAEGALDHGFHDTRQGPRYTVGPVVRQEILDRLLELNHERYRQETGGSAEQEGLFDV